MSEHAAAADAAPGSKPPFALERRESAIIAHWQAKVMEEDTFKPLIRAVDDAARADPSVTLVVLDLASVSVLQSLALGLVMQLFNGCKAHGRRLKLAALQPQVRQVFAVTRLDRLLQFADNVESAMKG